MCYFHVFAGASEEGVEGFFKGIGKGLLGLITQPLGGVMDMVSMAFDGLRRLLVYLSQTHNIPK